METVDQIEVKVQGSFSAKITYGLQGGTDFKHIEGLMINLVTIELIEVSGTIDYMTGEIEWGTINYIGKNGETVTSHGISGTVPITLGGIPVASVGAGASQEEIRDEVTDKIKQTEQSTSTSIGLLIGYTMEKNLVQREGEKESSIKVKVGVGAEAGVFLVGKVELSPVEITFVKKDN